jgi:hypothetical protein
MAASAAAPSPGTPAITALLAPPVAASAPPAGEEREARGAALHTAGSAF